MDTIRRKANLCRAIKLAYGSLKTHYLYSIKSPPKKHIEEVGDEAFSAKAIREYAEIILINACELEQVAKEEKRDRLKLKKRRKV